MWVYLFLTCTWECYFPTSVCHFTKLVKLYYQSEEWHWNQTCNWAHAANQVYNLIAQGFLNLFSHFSCKKTI